MRRIFHVLTGLVVAIALLTPLATAAPSPTAKSLAEVQIDPGLLDPGSLIGTPLKGLKFSPNEPVSLIVRLSGPTLSSQLAESRQNPAKYGGAPLSTAKMRTMQSNMAARQAVTKKAITQVGAKVAGTFQFTLNGFLVHAKRSQIEAIAKIPGVVRVGRAPLLKPDLANAVPFIGAKRVKDELKIDGKGAVIAVLDTGVDYTHKNFGGPGTVQAYTSNNEDIVEPGSFPTEKVIGGVDLAGKIYSPSCDGVDPATLPPNWICSGPTPDDDPLDPPGGGHGSHVAGIATGNGINAFLAPGVAPGAKLVMVKVFGDPVGAPGSTDLANSAIEWVTRHNLGLTQDYAGILDSSVKIHVINMSLGSAYGSDMDAANEAISAAVEAGVTVVASAGNNGNEPYITGSPAAAQMAVSVASSYADGFVGLEVLSQWDEGGAKERREGGLEAVGGWTKSLETATKIKGDLALFGLGCNGGTPAQDVKEKIALIERGVCSFYEKVANAQAAGAIAAIVYSTPNRLKVAAGCGAPSPCQTRLNPPTVVIDNDYGMALKAMLEKDMKVTVTLDPSRVLNFKYEPWVVDTISDFSSRGPDRFSAGVKPQIAAPGSEIISTASGTGDGYLSLSGTSMAGPMIAGVAGLLWQRNLDQKLLLSAADIGALAMNYAQPTIAVVNQLTGPRAGVVRQGAGRTNVYNSAVGNTVVRSDKGIAELGFSNLHFTDSIEVVRKISVRNLANAPKTYKLSSTWRFPAEDDDKGLTLLFRPDQITVPAKGSQDVEVTLSVDATKVRGWNLNSLEAVSPARETELARLEVDGSVLVTEVDGAGAPVVNGDAVGVPFYTLPHRHACVDVDTTKTVELGAVDAEAPVSFTNNCGKTGTLEAYRYVGSDPSESKPAGAAMPGKVDIQNVGLRYGDINVDPRTPDRKDTVMDFLVDMAGGARSPFDLGAQIYIDSDMNKRYDHVLILAYAPQFAANPATAPQRFLVISGTLDEDTVSIIGSSLEGEFYTAYDIDSSVLHLTTRAANIGVDTSGGDLKFGFGIWVADGADDYPLTNTYLGYDYAPDGMIDVKTGDIQDYFVFDQMTSECTDLVNDKSQSLLDLDTVVTMSARFKGDFTAVRSCEDSEDLGKQSGFLFSFNGLTDQAADARNPGVWFAYQHTNPPEMPGSTVPDAEVLGISLEPAAPTRWFNYIPLVAQSYEGLSPTPAPTVEPTAEPTAEVTPSSR